MFEDDELDKIHSETHKVMHAMFGIFACTGMAHLVMTTFDVPGISYARVFLVGAFYVTLGITVKLGHHRTVYFSIAAAVFSMFGSLIEFMITGSHFLATGLVVFDAITIFLVQKYLRVRDLPLPDGVDINDMGLKYQRAAKPETEATQTTAPAPTSKPATDGVAS